MSVATWPTRRLGDIASMGSGGTPSRSVSRYFGGGIPWVSITDMTSSGKYVSSTATTLTDEGLKSSAARLYAPDVVLYAMYASLGEVCLAVGRVSSSQAVLGIQPGVELDREFLYYHLEAIKPRVKELGQQGTQANLNAGMVRDFKVQLPPMAEQHEISNALRDADDLITTLEHLIAKKQAIKQGLMQQLLSGRTRLPGFDEPWSESKIGDFATVRAGGTPSTSIVDYWGGDIPWMSSGEIHQKQVYQVRGRITQLGLQKSSAQVLPPGTVLMALAGQGKTRGTVAVSRIELTTNQSIAGIFPSEQHDSDYLYYNLDARYAELRGESAGDGGRGGLNLTIIKRLVVPFPAREEQSAIARVLLDADAEIAVLRVRLAKVHAVKSGMMQQLLTGRVRLPVEVAA